MPADAAEIVRLAERVEAGTKSDNALDVLIELALFEPCETYISARANSAGTKVIYTAFAGREWTHWAPDHTFDAAQRAETAAALRARAAQQDNEVG